MSDMPQIKVRSRRSCRRGTSPRSSAFLAGFSGCFGVACAIMVVNLILLAIVGFIIVLPVFARLFHG